MLRLGYKPVKVVNMQLGERRMKFKIEDKFKTKDKVVNRGGKHMDVLLGNDFCGFFEQYKDMKVGDKR